MESDLMNLFDMGFVLGAVVFAAGMLAGWLASR